MRLLPIILLIALLMPICASAQEVYRCEDAQGRRVFADQPCRLFGALPLPSDSDPMGTPPSAEELRAMAELTAAAEAEARAEAERTPPQEAEGCVGSDPQRLAEGLAAAIGQSDLNAIAGLFHWPAAGQGTARRVFERAEMLIRSAPVQVLTVAAPVDDGWLWAGLPPPAQQALPDLEVRAEEDSGRVLQRFRLVANAGCVWLLP